MKNDPTRREVREEMTQEIREITDKFARKVRGLFPSLTDFGLSSIKHFAYPSINRYFGELDNKYIYHYQDSLRYQNVWTDRKGEKHTENLLSGPIVNYTRDDTPLSRECGRYIGGFVRFSGTAALLFYARESPWLLLIPGVTNAVSGIYELGQYWKDIATKKLRERK